jgi:hypothetical protein
MKITFEILILSYYCVRKHTHSKHLYFPDFSPRNSPRQSIAFPSLFSVRPTPCVLDNGKHFAPSWICHRERCVVQPQTRPAPEFEPRYCCTFPLDRSVNGRPALSCRDIAATTPQTRISPTVRSDNSIDTTFMVTGGWLDRPVRREEHEKASTLPSSENSEV